MVYYVIYKNEHGASFDTVLGIVTVEEVAKDYVKKNTDCYYKTKTVDSDN